MRSVPFGYFLFFILLLTFFSCSKDPEVDIDPEFQVYVDRFIAEAGARGLEIDFTDTGLTVRFEDVPDDVLGTCSELGTGTTGDHTVNIGRASWQNLTDREKERLIFHELGHCELNRVHDNQVFSNGDWKSIMLGDPLPKGKTALINYFGIRKPYYIDELFDNAAPRPDWVAYRYDYEDISEDQKMELYSFSGQNVFEVNAGLRSAGNFEIEIELQQNAVGFFLGFAWGGRNLSDSHHFYFYQGNALYISSGQDLYGHLHVVDLDRDQSVERNVLTVRKIGDLYYYYLNREFIYWTEYFPINSDKITSLVHKDADGTYHSISVSKLNI